MDKETERQKWAKIGRRNLKYNDLDAAKIRLAF